MKNTIALFVITATLLLISSCSLIIPEGEMTLTVEDATTNEVTHVIR